MTEANKEIDLIELYQKILVFVFRNILTFVIFAIIGAILGTAYYYKKANTINTQFLAETSDISGELVYSLTDKIAFAIETSDIESLKSDLNIDETILEDIDELSVDTSGSILNISIISSSRESLLPFTEALVNFYNKQEYILKKQRQKQEETRNLLTKIEEEISNISKFQEQFLSGNQDGKVTINQVDGSHSEKLRLYEMKQECEETLRQDKAITLINKDNNIVKRDASLLKIIVISILFSIIFAFVYFFIRFSIALKNRA